MTPLCAVRKTGTSARENQYRSLSLVKLVEQIVDKGDRPALEEFHTNRRLFRRKIKPPLLFIEYLDDLRESTARRVWIANDPVEVSERAYAYTLNKFLNLPGRNESSQEAEGESDRNMKPKGVDCRYYFRAFLEHIARSFKTDPPANGIEEETRAAMIMQGLVRRHFYLSVHEAERKPNPFWSRYNWNVNGGRICVWLPVSLAGRERRVWLEKNIDKPDPWRLGERERTQSIIDSKFIRESFVPFDEAIHLSKEEAVSLWPDSDKDFETSLAQVVADEKTKNIKRQRPSIRALGEERLKDLVLRIFNDLSSGKYEDKNVARDFGLKKATFSRFAGSRWLLTKSAIPDLWLNTAEVLSSNPTFKEVTIVAGVWKEVQNTLERNVLPCEEETSHGQ